MEPLCIQKLPASLSPDNVHELSQFMDSLKKNPVDHINWKSFPEKPEVRFSIAWDPNHICIKYFVHEKVIRARFTEDNAPVWKDSCVEFFVSPGDDGLYYNFETNCIGTCLAEKGLSRSPREKLPPSLLSHIKRYPSLGVTPFEEKTGDFSWNLLIIIPKDVFTDHTVNTFTGKTFRANFYKCGDELSRPHYLSWHPIDTPEPDFHRPEFFGEIRFC